MPVFVGVGVGVGFGAEDLAGAGVVLELWRLYGTEARSTRCMCHQRFIPFVRLSSNMSCPGLSEIGSDGIRPLLAGAHDGATRAES